MFGKEQQGADRGMQADVGEKRDRARNYRLVKFRISFAQVEAVPALVAVFGGCGCNCPGDIRKEFILGGPGRNLTFRFYSVGMMCRRFRSNGGTHRLNKEKANQEE
jgi:hypothetical protein